MPIRKPCSTRFPLKGILIEKNYGFLEAGFSTSEATFYVDDFSLRWTLNLEGHSAWDTRRNFRDPLVIHDPEVGI
jgi:hypothetical protein